MHLMYTFVDSKIPVFKSGLFHEISTWNAKGRSTVHLVLLSKVNSEHVFEKKFLELELLLGMCCDLMTEAHLAKARFWSLSSQLSPSI
jgi:hypothetical protein